MRNKNDPAFPFVVKNLSQTQVAVCGLTKLEWLAGMALNGMLSYNATNTNLALVATCACNMAEAMIAELEKRSK